MTNKTLILFYIKYILKNRISFLELEIKKQFYKVMKFISCKEKNGDDTNYNFYYLLIFSFLTFCQLDIEVLRGIKSNPKFFLKSCRDETLF